MLSIRNSIWRKDTGFIVRPEACSNIRPFILSVWYSFINLWGFYCSVPAKREGKPSLFFLAPLANVSGWPKGSQEQSIGHVIGQLSVLELMWDGLSITSTLKHRSKCECLPIYSLELLFYQLPDWHHQWHEVRVRELGHYEQLALHGYNYQYQCQY